MCNYTKHLIFTKIHNWTDALNLGNDLESFDLKSLFDTELGLILSHRDIVLDNNFQFYSLAFFSLPVLTIYWFQHLT